MITLSYIFFSIGFLIALYYGLSLVRMAYAESALLAIGCLLVPVVLFAYSFVHWDETKPTFLRFMIAIPFTIIGVALYRAH